MRLHPLAAACLAALLCAARTSCTRQEDADDTAESPVGAAVDPGPGEADETSAPPEQPEEEWPFGTPVGWADQPMALDAPSEAEDSDAEDSGDGEEKDGGGADPEGSGEADAPADDGKQTIPWCTPSEARADNVSR